jgi:general secretion pathway protein L
MHVISIDIGTYSIKFTETNVDRKSITHFGMREVVLDQFKEQKDRSFNWGTNETQLNIIAKYLSEVEDEVKIIFQAPNQILTNRFLELPIKNKKKAELMIPFQLEDNIPLPLEGIHQAFSITQDGEKCHSVVSFAKQDDFQTFYQEVENRDIVPDQLISETSCMESYFTNQNYSGAYMILDLGHTTTKGYVFLNNKLISSHISYIAGKNLNEAISSTYKISMDESEIYKHQNCFLLTSNQYEEVDENQKVFAQLMDQTLIPLIADIKRWELGFRVHKGIKIANIYACGGTSNIKNVLNYLTHHTGIKTSYLDTFEGVRFRGVDTDSKFKRKFTMTNLMANTFKKGHNSLNLLRGEFAQSLTDDLPLHSMSFIGTRMLAVTILILGVLFTERYFLTRDLKVLNSTFSKSMKKNPKLGITSSSRNSVIKGRPERAYKKLRKKHKSIIDEIKTIQSAISINSISPLTTLSSVAKSTKAWLNELSVLDDGFVEAKFVARNMNELKKLKTIIEGKALKKAFLELDKSKKTLRVEFINK